MALLLDYTSLYYIEDQANVRVVEVEDDLDFDCFDHINEYDLEDEEFDGECWQRVVAFRQDGPEGVRVYEALVKIDDVWWHFDMLTEYTAMETDMSDEDVEDVIQQCETV